MYTAYYTPDVVVRWSNYDNIIYKHLLYSLLCRSQHPSPNENEMNNKSNDGLAVRCWDVHHHLFIWLWTRQQKFFCVTDVVIMFLISKLWLLLVYTSPPCCHYLLMALWWWWLATLPVLKSIAERSVVYNSRTTRFSSRRRDQLKTGWHCNDKYYIKHTDCATLFIY